MSEKRVFRELLYVMTHGVWNGRGQASLDVSWAEVSFGLLPHLESYWIQATFPHGIPTMNPQHRRKTQKRFETSLLSFVVREEGALSLLGSSLAVER